VEKIVFFKKKTKKTKKSYLKILGKSVSEDKLIFKEKYQLRILFLRKNLKISKFSENITNEI